MNDAFSSIRRRSSQCAAVTRSASSRGVAKELRLPTSAFRRLTSRMVGPLRVAGQLLRIEVDVAQAPRAVALRLILEVLRLRIAALAAGRHRLRAHLVAELDDRDEAVAGVAVHLLRVLVAARAERSERAPARRREADRDARSLVAERLDDVAGQALEAVDLAPRRIPLAEVGGELVRRGGERVQLLVG